MRVEKKVPEIRFKGFSGEWDSRCLGSLCLIGDIDHRMPETKKTGIPYLMTGNFYGINGLDFESAKLISVEDYEQLSKKIKPEYGDILFARYASVGAVRYVETEVEFLISYSCAILKTNNTSYGKYLFYFFQTKRTQGQIELDINTGSQRNIGIDSLKNLLVTLPKPKEQTAIGNTFQKLDTLIRQHQQKHDQLSNIKKAMLEKMFPKQGETTPEIRFKGFSGEWGSYILGDVSEITTGKLDANAMKANGDYDFYTSGIKKYKIDIPAFEGPAITIAGNGATVGYMHLADGEFNAYQRTYVLTNFKANRYFLFCNIGKVLPLKINQEVRAGNIPYIVLDMLTDLEVKLPFKKEEQTAIGNHFQKLDTLISQHQNQITKLNNIKQACLSKMFV